MGEIFKNFADKTFRHSDEETFWDLEARAKEALALILEREEEKIIVVTHGLVLKMMFGVMIFGDALSPEMFARFRHSLRNSNTGITICEYEPDRVPDIDHAYTGWRCITFNDHAHLG